MKQSRYIYQRNAEWHQPHPDHHGFRAHGEPDGEREAALPRRGWRTPLATIRAQILLEVNAAYFDALQAQSVVEVAKQTVATRQLTFDQVSELAKNKLKSGLDASFAQVDLG